MKAILLATGERDNLTPLTNDYPSPMLPIANRPVITYPVELMIRHQFRDILVSVLHQPDMIETYCETGRRWNVDFTYLLQRKELGSAGAIKRAQSLLTESFLVMPGDALVDINLSELYEYHCAHGGIATVLLAPRIDGKSDIPTARLDSNSQICSIQSDAWTPNALCFTDVYIFEPEIFQYVPYQTFFDCKNDLVPKLLAEGIAVQGYVLSDYWNALDSIAGFQSAQADYLRSLNHESTAELGKMPLSHPYVEAGNFGDGIWRGPNVTTHPTAQIYGPVLLGAGSQIGRDVIIGPNAIIGSNCIVDDGATIENSTVFPDTYIGKWVKVQKKIVNASTLIDIASETCVEVTDRHILGRAGTQEANALLRNILERLLALSMLLLALPLLAALILLGWIAGVRSLFIREPRVGCSPLQRKSGTEAGRINLLRLRTRLDDGSYTFIGQWVEKWGFHRLPELINVMSGELALVGVKPLSEGELELIHEDWQHRRFDCPAGFTGRWYTELNPGSDADDLFVVDAYQTAVQSTSESLYQVLRTWIVWWHRHKMIFKATRQNNRPVVLRGRLPRYVDDNPIK